MEEEKFRDIKGYEGLYQVSNLGNIKALSHIKENHYDINTKQFKTITTKERLLKLAPNYNSNYIAVTLYKNGESKRYFVHRLVAEAFITNPDNLPIINHKDENPMNNRVENLEWCTVKYNSNYGTVKPRLSKLMKGNTNSPTKAVQCIETGAIYPSIQCAHQETGILNSSISQVCSGKQKTAGGYHWKHIMNERSDEQ